MAHEHHNHEHNHHNHSKMVHRHFPFTLEALSLILLLGCVVASHYGILCGGLQTVSYIVAVLPVGIPILKEAFGEWRHGDIFNEFTLMVLACACAYIIKEYPEGVAILLFYSFSEKLEGLAGEQSRNRIKRLLKGLDHKVNIEGRGMLNPEDVKIGEILTVKPGERCGLDGELLNDGGAEFDTSALTGESVPVCINKGSEVLSESIPVDKEVRIRVTKPFSESYTSRILKLIEEASSRKSKDETLLRKITRWYTPAVMLAALAVFIIPLLVAGNVAEWREWFERALVVLVCACPCALVVSIPLSYFTALGVASADGLLLKSSGALERLRGCHTLILDKTGTLTTGDFHITAITLPGGSNATNTEKAEILSLAAALDKSSLHPLAKAICREFSKIGKIPNATDVHTEPHGICGIIDGKDILVGSAKLMHTKGISTADTPSEATAVYVAKDRKWIGTITFSDTIKPGTAETLSRIRREGIDRIEILSGDNAAAVDAIGKALKVDSQQGELLPEDKQRIVGVTENEGGNVLFVGDGINDAASLAAARVGIAIGEGGTDLAMESADGVLTSPTLAPLAEGIWLSRRVASTVFVNVAVAVAAKLGVMVAGAMGYASLWAAVFADTGITLLAVGYTILRIRRKTFRSQN